MVTGMPSLLGNESVCAGCLKGKQRREHIPKKSIWRVAWKLELIHADLCGLISPTTNGQKRYFISFIDDFSMGLLPYKSDAFTAFKQFKNSVERESALSIKCLRTIRGEEFISSEFNETMESRGN
ncbi:LOW QUALITY PROTEIN: hypothetical protein V2J09_004012 [Rumex salicifolius]